MGNCRRLIPFGRDVIEEFFSCVFIEPTGCWRWRGYVNGDGYGIFKIGPAARFAWSLAHGKKFPKGKHNHCAHWCDRDECVSPYHLRHVERVENFRDVARRRPYGHVIHGLAPMNDMSPADHARMDTILGALYLGALFPVTLDPGAWSHFKKSTWKQCPTEEFLEWERVRRTGCESQYLNRLARHRSQRIKRAARLLEA